MRTNPGERPYQSQPVCQKGAYKNKSKNEMVQDMGRNKNKTSGVKYIYGMIEEGRCALGRQPVVVFTFTFRISLCREKHLADSFFLFYIIHSILLLQQAEFEMRRQSSEATVARKSSAITLALVIRMSTWRCRQSAEKKMMRVREEGWPVFVIDVFVIELCAGLLSPLINNELLYAYVRG